MLLRKAHGGASVGPYIWKNDGDVVEVDDKTAAELLRIPGGDFTAVQPDEEPAEPSSPEPDAPATDPAAVEPSSEPENPPEDAEHVKGAGQDEPAAGDAANANS